MRPNRLNTGCIVRFMLVTPYPLGSAVLPMFVALKEVAFKIELQVFTNNR
jgi:hypothetical protein